MEGTQRIVIEFPDWMVEALDKEAERLKVPRQAVVKMLVDQGLEILTKKIRMQDDPAA